MSETDIVVIGAGAAGLAAGEALMRAGARFLVLEAGTRRGGRAWTDFDSFEGIAFDRGCHWLHSAEDNPLRPLADQHGFRYDTEYSYENYTVFENGERLDARRLEALSAKIEAAFERLEGLREDQAAADALDPADPAYTLFDHYVGLDFSHPARDVAVAEFRRAEADEEGENYPVCDGLGALIGTLAAHVPVTLDTAVQTVRRRGKGFRLVTTKGEIDTQAVIVTVSTSVIAAGGIRFDPALPEEIGSAIAACPVGCAEKLGLLFDTPLEILPPRTNLHALSSVAEARRAVTFNAHCADPRLVVAMVAGAHAEALVAEGEAAVTAAVMDELASIAGADVRKRLVKHSITNWRHDPFFLGAYSAMSPGHTDARSVLAEPFDAHLFLAGEATAGARLGTVHGARQTGVLAAERALAALGAS